MATPIRHEDLAKGLDGLSPENKLADGRWLKSTNLDPTLTGSVRQRDGFQRFAGLVPLRVKSIARSGTALRLTFHDWVDHSKLRSRPIVLFGRASAAIGSLTTTDAAYSYTGFIAAAGYIEVQTSDAGATADALPQFNVYGLDVARFEAVSQSAGPRPGWVHHLDTFYDEAAKKRWPVCGMEGVFYAGHAHADLPAALQAERAPAIRATADSEVVLAPLFHEAAPLLEPTRGWLQHDDAGAHTVPVVSATCVGASLVRFDVPGISVGAGSFFSTLRIGLDRLTVEQASAAALNGDWVVEGATLDSGVLSITCRVPGVEDGRFDDAALGAIGAVWTDVIESTAEPLPVGAVLDLAIATRRSWGASDVSASSDSMDDGDPHGFEAGEPIRVSTSSVLPSGLSGDVVYYAAPLSETELALAEFPGGPVVALGDSGTGTLTLTRDLPPRATVVANAGSFFAIDGVRSTLRVASGAALQGTRRGRVHALREVGGSTLGVGSLVDGDVLEIDGAGLPETRRLAVRGVLPGASRAVADIVGDGVEALLTLDGSTNAAISPGDWLLVVGSPLFSGEWRVVGLIGSDTIQLDCAVFGVEGSGSWVQGHTVTLDDAVELDDAASPNALRPHRRWQAIERPASPNSALIDATTVRHLTGSAADAQPFTRSVSSGGSLVLVNGVDPPQRYDGAHLVRMGLPPQAPIALGGYTRLAPLAACVRPQDTPSAFTATGGTFTLTDAGAASKYPAGTWVRIDDDDTVNTFEFRGLVQGSDGSTKLGIVGQAVGTWTAGDLVRESVAGYYARLGQVDRAGRQTASAVTQARDHVYGFGRAAQLQLKLLRPPAWPGLDHARLETHVFRTPLTGEPVYARNRLILADWAKGAHYVVLKDSLVDPALFSGSEGYTANDEVVGALIPADPRTGAQELPTAWDFPPVAGCVSAADGRVLLGAPRSYPRFSIVFKGNEAAADVPISAGRLDGAVFHFRRGGATGTTPDQSSVQSFEFVAETNTSRYVAECQVEVPSATTFLVRAPSGTPFASFAVGDWVYMASQRRVEGGKPMQQHLDFVGWHQVQAKTDSTLTFATKARPALTISNANSGTDVITFSSAHGVPVGAAAPITFYGTLPSGLSTKRTYYFLASSETAGSVFDDPALSTPVDLISTTTGGSAIFAAPGGNSATSAGVYVYFASTKSRVPVVFPEIAMWDGVSTLNLIETVSTPQGLLNQAVIWLSAAINAAQSVCCESTGFRPWLLARAGEDFAAGELFVESPIVEPTGALPTLLYSLPTTGGAPLEVYLNGARAAASTSLAAEVKSFPYRVLRSYKNYPELFDNPFAQDASQSDSAIDIDPASGGVVHSVKPLFGESAFGTGVKEQLVLVGKDTGWWIVNVETKAVQRVNTRGIGLDYPRSVVETKNGVAFASRKGVFKINLSLDLVPIGRALGTRRTGPGETWAATQGTAADLLCATNDAGRTAAIFSFPGDRAFVYFYENEAENVTSIEGKATLGGVGPWTYYEGVPALGWTNLADESLLASSPQRVFSRRQARDATDWRDDDQPIAADGIYKPMDFGVLGLRKVLRSLTAAFRVESTQTGTTMGWADSTRFEWQPLDDFRLEVGAEDGLGSPRWSNLKTVSLSAPNRKGEIMALRIQNSTLDEGIELTELVFFVDPLGSGGVRGASEEDR